MIAVERGHLAAQSARSGEQLFPDGAGCPTQQRRP